MFDLLRIIIALTPLLAFSRLALLVLSPYVSCPPCPPPLLYLTHRCLRGAYVYLPLLVLAPFPRALRLLWEQKNLIH